jgi:hypothetical protein
MTRLATLACLLVSGLDTLQLFLRPWESARFGAVAGALLYALAALLIARNQAAGIWLARLIPAIPTVIIIANAVNGSLPDAWMVGIYAVQLVAAYDAWGPLPAHPAA